MFHSPATHAYILQSLLALIEERHARFNATLYQLEPDVKEAPGALRDLMATRTIAALTDPLLLQRGPADPGRFEEAEDFLLRVRSILHLEAERNQNVLSHELQERTADVLGYPGDEPRQRVERLMSDYFRHARTVSRMLEWMRRTAPTPVGPNLGLTRDGVRFLDPGSGGPNTGVVDRRIPGRARCRHRRHGRGAVVHSAARVALSRRGLYARATRSCGVSQVAQAAARPVRARCRKCTIADCSGACFPSSRRCPGEWCATSTTSTRSTSTRCSRFGTSNGS